MKYTRFTHSIGADAMPPAHPTRPTPGAAERPKTCQGIDPEPVCSADSAQIPPAQL